MEDKIYFFSHGVQYECDVEACGLAIKNYIKKNNKLKSGFDSDVCAYFKFKGISERTVSEIRNYSLTRSWSGNGDRKPSDDTMIKYYSMLGQFFSNNEYMFLKPVRYFIESSTVKDKLDWFCCKISNVLSCLKESDCFQRNLVISEFDLDYYINKLEFIRKEVWNVFRVKEECEIRNKLVNLIEEIEKWISDCSLPLSNQRWLEINPKLSYFDVVYEVIEEDPEFYSLVKNSESSVSFSFYPSLEQIQDRNEYFKENNYLSDMALYQREICETFSLLFEQDFQEYLHKTSKN